MADLTNKMAPDFELLDQNEKSHKLSSYRGQFVILYFYPKDSTPGCTIEAHKFRDNLEEFKKLNAVVLGVSKDSVKSHVKFAEKQDLNFPILSDDAQEVVNKYGVLVEKSMFGKKYMGVVRHSFLINPEGKIIKHYTKVKTLSHALEVLEDIKNTRKI